MRNISNIVSHLKPAMMKILFLAPFFCAVLVSSFRTETASFYGASYISVPLQDAKSTTDLQFKFRTRRSDAMLFLAAGSTDYCLVRLESGRLKVHINVGAGETELSSPKGLRLDDLSWHKVVISRREAAMTLQIDVIHVVKKQLPGRFFELNIHYGLFLGGQGDFSELFLGHLDTLRGCLSDVRYNGVNVLSRARERQGQVDVQGITWSCAPEFDATVDRHISFVEDGAFMAFPSGITRTGARWQFELKTTSRRGILLYNTGLTSRSDFVGVELVDGHLRLLLNKGNGALELRSQWAVVDGKWHDVVVQFNPTFMEISVDGAPVSQRLPQGGSRFLDLADIVYVGGIELNKRSRAVGQGLLTADTSFKGCLRSMTVEKRHIGIPDARVTNGILPDCVWEYPCVQDPCVAGSQCQQQGVDSFRCDCDQLLCIKPDYAESYKVFSKPTLVTDLEILVLTPLQVAEGDNALITTTNIDVVLDYAKFGVRDSGVLLHVVEHPRHGKLTVDVWERSTTRLMFTMLDLVKDKVRYLHDGSENHQDSIVLELELAPGPGFILPNYLQGHHSFVLHVNITPINDPPSLVLPPGTVLRLAQGTRKILSPEILRTEDPDSPNADLVYTVLSQEETKDKGYVEHVQSPGTQVHTFTQLEVDQGLIAYVHHGGEPGTNTRLALQVSDGIETSPAAFLRITAFPLQLRLVNNTGLILTHRTAAHITAANLTFTSNAEDADLDVRYEVVKSPQFGAVQRLRGGASDSQWQTVEHFTSHQLARDQIRYLHMSGDPTHDIFKFKVSVMEVHSPTLYDFRITFTELRLVPLHIHELQLNGSREAVLTDKQLLYQTQPLTTESSKIVYQVLRSPRYGTLHSSSSLKHHRLQSGDTFTQQDLDSARLRYRLHRKAYSHVHDDVTFRVSAPECASVSGTLGLLHVPTGQTRDEVRATLERLQVVEGGRQPVLRTHLDLATNGITELMYNVTHGPHHGHLDVMDVGLVTVLRRNTAYFSSRELMTERVFYVHDDSETKRDSFHFVALSSEEEDFQYVGIFHVDILLKNDNTPVRAVDKVFQIVTGGERLLTGRDLRYSDADIDTQPTDIVYTRRGIPNGGIYQASDPTVPMFEFTQDDLDNFRVLFRHEGDDYGKVGLWITDGQFYANGVLEVRASAPFVAVANNTGLVVQRGGIAVFTSTNLSAETNLNVWGEQLVFEVTENPRHGHLQLQRESSHFTQLDLENGHLAYHHNNSTAVNDHFRFRVDAGGTTTTEGMFNLRVFPAWYWEPLIVANNRTLHVEESTSVTIVPSYLKVMHPYIPASDITYLVVEPPMYGYLEVLSSQVEVEEDPIEVEEIRPVPATLFDQSLINDKRVHYIQAVANRTRDRFIVDVTNGISWLRGLVVQFLIVPEWLYVSGGELHVMEGHAVTLPESMLAVLTEYYRGRVTEYRVIEPPSSGILQSPQEPSIPLHKFSASQLKAGLVQYQHDGSERLVDQFLLRGIAGDKESVPATVRVLVTPVNDEPPHIVNNTGLILWEGSTAIITPTHLAAVDKDTGPSNLSFSVSSPRNGHVALVSTPNTPVRHFSQAEIDSQQIVYVHTGGDGGGFDLTVSDGVKTTGVLSFAITSHKVMLHLVSPGLSHLHVFPMRRQTLAPLQLLALASDARRPVSYILKSPPNLGRLMIDSVPPGNPRAAKNFTQHDVNSSRIFYEHTHPFFGLSTNDSFTFDVKADFAEPLLDQEMHIDISVSSGGLDQFLDAVPLNVEEGGVAVVQLNTSRVVSFLEAHADMETTPAILVQLLASPEHGELRVLEDKNMTTVTQQQLDADEVTYHHDHSDTLRDNIHLSLLLEPGDVLLCNITIPVHVQPVNDEPFSLSTAAPHISVVQGQSVVITRDNLLTEDPDTAPEGLIYDVISGPSHGRLLFRNETTNNMTPVVRFNQADIDAGRMLYQHHGPLQPSTFYFRVWDGHFNPVYTVFNIHVLPLALNVTIGPPVMLQQGSSVALITTDHLLAITNARTEEVCYNVTRVPRHGMVYLHDVATHQFGQLDVDKKRVMYVQTDMTTASDSMEILAWFPDTNTTVPGLELNVSVEPLMQMGNFTPIAGIRNKITLDVLDATPLAKLTGSNPGYQILHRPRYGRIKKIIRSSGDRRNMREREVNHFTHEEVKSGVIYYVARRLSDLMAHNDSLPFLLAVSIFQPARGELQFIVRPEREGGELSATPTTSLPPVMAGPKDPVGHEGGFIVASPNMSSDYVLIVSMVLGVMLLAVLVIIVVKCRSIQVGREDTRNCKSDLTGVPAVPLPRPPDVLQPTSPHPKRFTSNGSSPTPGNTPLPVPATVLQCKVIPLEPVDSVASSEPDLNSRYPYGVSDDPTEDWSSYDTSELGYQHRTANPMLRRNQYWV